MENNLHFQHKGLSALWASSLSWIVPFLLRAIDFLKVPCEVVRVRSGEWRTLDCLGQHCSLCPFEQGSILFLECPGWQAPYMGLTAPCFRELSPRSTHSPRIRCWVLHQRRMAAAMMHRPFPLGQGRCLSPLIYNSWWEHQGRQGFFCEAVNRKALIQVPKEQKWCEIQSEAEASEVWRAGLFLSSFLHAIPLNNFFHLLPVMVDTSLKGDKVSLASLITNTG